MQRRAKGEEGTAEEAGLGTGVELSRTGVKRGKKTWTVVQSTAAITLKLVDLSALSKKYLSIHRLHPLKSCRSPNSAASVAHPVNLRGDLNARISPSFDMAVSTLNMPHLFTGYPFQGESARSRDCLTRHNDVDNDLIRCGRRLVLWWPDRWPVRRWGYTLITARVPLHSRRWKPKAVSRPRDQLTATHTCSCQVNDQVGSNFYRKSRGH